MQLNFFVVKESFRSSAVKGNICNIAKGPSFGYNEDVVDMTQWNAVITTASQPVTLYTNYVEATFDANGGVYPDNTSTKVLSGDAGSALTIDKPAFAGYVFEGWKAEGTDDVYESISFFPAADTTYVAQWKSTTDKYDETVSFKTDIYRQNDNGEWVFTEKVIPGETVKARIYIDTTYFTNAGDIIVFYDSDFFEDADTSFVPGSYKELTMNTVGSAADANASGVCTYVPATSRVVKRLIDAGLIDQEFAHTHEAYTFSYKFDPAVSQKLSGAEYFAEWELKVKDTATGEGDFFVVEETIQNTSEAGMKGFINIPVGEEGGSDEDAYSLWEVNVNTEVESNPVTTISRIEFFKEKGQADPDFVIEGDINDPVDATTVPVFTKDGYTFMGWVPAEIANPTVADVVEVPEAIPFDELELVALWVNEVKITIDPSNGDPLIENTVTAGEAFDKPENPTKEGSYLAGWVDGEGNFMKELPDVYPAKDTTYTAVFEAYTYIVEYYVLNPDTLSYERVATANTVYGDVILATPPTFTAPAGFVLTPAYKDTTFTADSALADGETMPANNVKLYYKLVANEYPATFKLDGGNIDGNTADVIVNTLYNQQIKAPANPVKEGYTFIGWDPMVGIMGSEGAEFVATWEANTYTATYIVEGEEYEEYDIPFGADMEIPADPVLPGYNFVEWDPAVPATMPAGNVEYTAVFEKKVITITLELDGGKYDGSEADIVISGKYGDAITAPDATKLEKQGYVFGGWEPALPETLPTEDATYTAIWNPAKDTPYTVEVYYQDTEGNYPSTPDEVIAMTGETNSLINVAVATPYGFEISEDEGDYGKDVAIAADGSTVYKVYFDRLAYTVVFDGNNGTIDGKATVSEDYLYLSTVTAPADEDLYREGYTFAGWEPAVDSEATKAVTYKAKWTVNSYDVNYIVKGEAGAEDVVFATDSFEFGADLEVTDEEPVKKGYTFKSWTNVAGGTYTFPATMPAADINVYAKFTPNPYDAKFFEEADSTAPFDVINTEFDSAISAPASEPTKEGYEFGGWSTDGENPLDFASGDVFMTEEGMDFVAVWVPAEQDVPVKYYFMDAEGNYVADTTKDTTVKAKTEETAKVVPADVENYTVNTEKSVLEAVVAADGTTVLEVYYDRNTTKLVITVDGKETVIEGIFGSEVPADQIPETDKPGYTFNGWKDDEGNIVDLPTVMPEGNETYEADYTVNVHNVTFMVDGEVYYGPTKTAYNAPIAVPSVPTKNGYVFAAWKDADGKQPSDYAGMPDKDLVFEVVWTANSNVGYVLNVYEMGTDGTYPAEDKPTAVYSFNDGIVGDDRTITPVVPTGFTLDVESSVTPEKSELTGKIPATGTLVLKAYYARDQYTLYIDEDGIVTEEVYYYGQAIADRADPVKKGYTFVEWTPEYPDVMPAEDVTVTAQFTKNSYDVVFDAGEGTFTDGTSSATAKVPYLDNIIAPADPAKEGFVFLGWSKDGETVLTNLGKMDDNGETFIAVWGKATVVVTFYNYLTSDKGPAVPEGQQTYVYDQATGYKFGDEIVFPADPVIANHEDHYVFTGWVDADGNPVEAGATVPAQDLDIYATYERVKVMLIPKNDTCTTVIDRAGLTVDDYTADSRWYVYGLEEILTLNSLLTYFIDVSGDGRIEVTKITDFSCYGTGTIIDVYDNVTGELVESFRIVIFGDLNGDSYINGIDLSIMTDECQGVTGWSYEDELHYVVKAANLRFADDVISHPDRTILIDHVLGLAALNQETAVLEY